MAKPNKRQERNGNWRIRARRRGSSVIAVISFSLIVASSREGHSFERCGSCNLTESVSAVARQRQKSALTSRQ
jgi:hypothetical protein